MLVFWVQHLGRLEGLGARLWRDSGWLFQAWHTARTLRRHPGQKPSNTYSRFMLRSIDSLVIFTESSYHVPSLHHVQLHGHFPRNVSWSSPWPWCETSASVGWGQFGPGGSSLDVALSDRLPGVDAMPSEAKSLERFDSVPWSKFQQRNEEVEMIHFWFDICFGGVG